ncbi:MAG: metallophosphoesterase [Moraxella sp.]|nr:metallophosphoesterase [Moraxella sp.]
MKQKKAILIGVMVFIVLGVLVYSHLLKVVHYGFDDVGYRGERALKAALITDLHACYYGEDQHWLVEILKQERPDVILLGGDIYDDARPFDHADTLLKVLPAIAPTYYVNGNHETWLPTADYDALMARIASHGVHILHGDSVFLPNTNVSIHGVSDPDGGAFEADLRRVSGRVSADRVDILLSHRPELIDVYRANGFDVVLSGHAHGGQWRVPFLINGVFAPNQGLFPPYAGGLYAFDDELGYHKFIVSRGLARESTRVPRIFNRPELVFFTLSKS